MTAISLFRHCGMSLIEPKGHQVWAMRHDIRLQQGLWLQLRQHALSGPAEDHLKCRKYKADFLSKRKFPIFHLRLRSRPDCLMAAL